jgi:hypothetical protein
LPALLNHQLRSFKVGVPGRRTGHTGGPFLHGSCIGVSFLTYVSRAS